MDAPYRKLPGKGMRRDGNFVSTHYAASRLWMGEDHLLLVEQAYAEQTVRRFYFKDIQGIQLIRTSRFAIYNMIFGALLGFLPAPYLMPDEPLLSGICFTFGFLALMFLTINLIKGPTSRGFILTAVHRMDIPSFNRLRNARKALATIIPAIEVAQGTFDMTAFSQEPSAVSAATVSKRASLDPAFTPGSAVARSKQPASPGTRKWHRSLYAVLLFDGLVSLLSIVYHGLATLLLGTISFLAAAFLCAMGIARQHSPLIPPRVRLLTKFTAGYLMLGLIVGWVEYMVLAASNPNLASGSQHELFLKIASIDPLQNSWMLVHLAISGCISCLLGTVGIASLLSPPPPPEEPTIPLPPPLAPPWLRSAETTTPSTATPPPLGPGDAASDHG